MWELAKYDRDMNWAIAAGKMAWIDLWDSGFKKKRKKHNLWSATEQYMPDLHYKWEFKGICEDWEQLCLQNIWYQESNLFEMIIVGFLSVKQ